MNKELFCSVTVQWLEHLKECNKCRSGFQTMLESLPVFVRPMVLNYLDQFLTNQYKEKINAGR